jgi:dolichyl-phosphate-mannose-protein mannosyltransferase
MSAPADGARARRVALWLALVAALAFGLRAARLSSQPLIGDDASVGLTAQQFMDSGLPEPTMWNHPRLRDELVSLSLGAFGETPWGLKAWSVLLGTLSAPATALLVLALGGGAAAAAVAALLVAIDPLHLDFSRQAINDVYLAFFPVAALAAAWRYRVRRRTGWLALAGALFGCGLASKWSVAFPLALAGAVLAADALRRPAPRRERAAELAFLASALALLPLAIYLLTFLPWFGRGYSLAEWVRFHGAMAFETATHTGYAGTKRPGYAGEVIGAWRWFVEPVYYADIAPPQPGSDGAYVIGLSNPLTWLAVWPAAALALWRAARRRDRVAAALLAVFAAAYLPFALSLRRPIWTNSAVGVVPFAMALVAWAALEVRRLRPRLAAGWIAATAASAAVLWFPAAGLSTPVSDSVVHAVVPPIAFVPKHAPEGPGR